MTKMITVRKEIRISAAHQLYKHEGKCSRPHGHNYLVEAFAQGRPDVATGIVIDFYEMSLHLEATVGRFDHRDLNANGSSILGSSIETTAENLAEAWLYDLKQLNPKYIGLRVWETESCYAQAGKTE